MSRSGPARPGPAGPGPAPSLARAEGAPDTLDSAPRPEDAPEHEARPHPDGGAPSRKEPVSGTFTRTDGSDDLDDPCGDDPRELASVSHAPPPIAKAARKILLIEDNASDAFLVLELLEVTGADETVVHARSLAEALPVLRAGEVDAVLLDLHLPDGAGVDCLAAVQAAAGEVPIVILTGLDADSELALECIDAGAQDYLSKSTLNAQNLRRSIAYAFARTREASERRRADALEAADRKKDQFLAMLAHELRNPLATVVAHLEIFRRRGLHDPVLVDSRDAMLRQVSHLTRMIDDLLDVSRVTRGKLELQVELVELGAVIERALEVCRPLLEERAIVVELYPAGEPLPLQADPVRLTQVLSNLLGNACRYSEPEGRVWLRWRREDEAAVIEVADEGCGIPGELLDHVFEMFVQARRGGRGLGLGLTLVKQLVELHGGEVQARSEGVGQGATLTVRLPTAGVRPSQIPQVPAAPVEHTALDVLVIEDDDDLREAMRWLCIEWGHSVRCAQDGESGVAEAVRAPPELVLVDLGLPGIDGHEVARRLRRELGPTGPRMIALSGFGTDADRARSRRSGFDLHVVKPASPEELRAAMTAVAEGAHRGAPPDEG